MAPFEFLSVAISFVLGLAVTVVLTSLLAAYRARRRARMAWIPFAWATYILVIQFDIWWEIYGLVTLEAWTAGAFVLLLLIAFVLFAAGGLVLPTGVGEYPQDLGEYFDEDGRGSVALVGVFTALGSTANVTLFGLGWLDPMNLFNALALVILLVASRAQRGRVQSASTIAYGVWLAAYLWLFVPSTY